MKPITPVYIDDIIGEIVQVTSAQILETIKANQIAAIGDGLMQQIRYSKSSYEELIENLYQADNGSTDKYTKYPLIHLVQDYTVERGVDAGSYGSTSLNILFIHQTEETYKIEDRDANVFKPVLWPMYYSFMAQLFNSGWTFGNDKGEYRHKVTKRAFWGKRKLEARSADGSKNSLNDFVDAIEINNLQVKFNFNNCP